MKRIPDLQLVEYYDTVLTILESSLPVEEDSSCAGRFLIDPVVNHAFRGDILVGAGFPDDLIDKL